jgi:hypothetical protein
MVMTMSTSSILAHPGLNLPHFKSGIILLFHAPGRINVKGVFHTYNNTGSLKALHLWINPIAIWDQFITKYRNLGNQVLSLMYHQIASLWTIQTVNSPEASVPMTSQQKLPMSPRSHLLLL